MLRKHLLTDRPARRVVEPGEKDIVALATVWVTSEATDASIDNAFDHHRGPGGSRWVAGEPGLQRLILAFDAPQTLRTLRLEVEERDVHRTQELYVAISRDGENTYQTLLRQEYNFSPPGTTFECEEWAIPAEGVTHLQLVITPDKGGAPCHATLTALAIQ
ncbi:MAG TPA: hypothetical protein VI542_02395 [Candidatus Tectomicrobia bacterium]